MTRTTLGSLGRRRQGRRREHFLLAAAVGAAILFALFYPEPGASDLRGDATPMAAATARG